MGITLQGAEVPEEFAKIFFRYSYTSVFNLHIQHTHSIRIFLFFFSVQLSGNLMSNAWFFNPCCHCYWAVLSKLNSIRKKIHTNLLNTLFVPKNKFFWKINVDFSFLAGCLHLNYSNNFNDWLINIHSNRLCLKRASLNLSMVKIVIYIIEH